MKLGLGLVILDLYDASFMNFLFLPEYLDK
jgi:hypothetical protein